MEDVIQQFESYLQNDWGLKLVTCLVIVLITFIVARLVTRFLRHVLMQDTNVLPTSSIFVNLARSLIWIVGICILLDTCFDVNVSAVIAALGVGGIAVSLGFQDTISNLIGGLQVSLMKIIKPGDNIRVGTDAGVVRDVTWRHTAITNSVGETVIIPNSVINKAALVKLPPISQVAIPFVVRSAGDDLDEVAHEIERGCGRAVQGISAITQDPHVVFTEVTEFGFRGKVTFRIDDIERVGDCSDAALRVIAPYTRRQERGQDGEKKGPSS